MPDQDSAAVPRPSTPAERLVADILWRRIGRDLDAGGAIECMPIACEVVAALIAGNYLSCPAPEDTDERAH